MHQHISITYQLIDRHCQLTNLDARVGIRSLVVMVRSNSEYNQAPLSFFKHEAMAVFLHKVYGIDVQDMLTQMEGYSVAGGTLVGMATTYKERVQTAKSELSTKLRQALSVMSRLMIMLTNNQINTNCALVSDDNVDMSEHSIVLLW